MQAAPGPPLKFLGVLLEVLGPNGVVDVILRVPTRLPLKAPGQQVGVVHVPQQVCSRVTGAGEEQGWHFCSEDWYAPSLVQVCRRCGTRLWGVDLEPGSISGRALSTWGNRCAAASRRREGCC